MNIVIVGQKELGKRVFEALQAAGHSILTVYAPCGDKLAAAAEESGVPWIESPKPFNFPDGVGLIVCAHAHTYIGGWMRALATHGAIGYHPSLLPRHRGKDAIRWAVHMCDAITGGTVYWITDEVDGGPIARQEWCWIIPGESASDLWRRELMPMGVRLLLKAVTDISEGNAKREPQDEQLATWEPSWERPPMDRK